MKEETLISKWGNPTDFQVKYHGDEKNPEKQDKDYTRREFCFPCGLVSLLEVINSENKTKIIINLEGFPSQELPIDNVKFNFTEDEKIATNPLVKVFFEGRGTRQDSYDDLIHVNVSHIDLWFKDKKQMDEYAKSVVTFSSNAKNANKEVAKNTNSNDNSGSGLITGMIIGSILF